MAIPRLTHHVCRLSFVHRDSHGLRRTLVAAVLLAGVTSIATAATTTYTSRSSFEASLPTGYFFNNFSGVPNAVNAPVSSVSGSGGTPAISYTIAAPTAGLGVFPTSARRKRSVTGAPATTLWSILRPAMSSLPVAASGSPTSMATGKLAA